MFIFRGQWHGDVAIKMLNFDSDSDNAAQLSAFKLEVIYCLFIMLFTRKRNSYESLAPTLKLTFIVKWFISAVSVLR